MKTKSRMRFAKTLVSLLLVVILLFAAACNPEQGTGGGGGTGEEDKTGVKALRITKNPRTEYAEGEVFSPAGIVIVADWYGDDEPEELWPGEYTYTHKDEPLTTDITEIVFSYEEATCKLPITVTSRNVTGIEILSKPEPYVLGESGKDDFTVKTVCADGEGWELSSDMFTLTAIDKYSNKATATYKLGTKDYTVTTELSVIERLNATVAMSEGSVVVPDDNSGYIELDGELTLVQGETQYGAIRLYTSPSQNPVTGDRQVKFYFYSKYDDTSATVSLRIANVRQRGNTDSFYYDQVYLSEHAQAHFNGDELDTDGMILPGCSHAEYVEKGPNAAMRYVDLEWNVTLHEGYNEFVISNKVTEAGTGWTGLHIGSLTVSLNDKHFGSWIVDQQPTCEKQGHRYRDCAECGEHEEEVLTTSHEVTTVEIKTPPTQTMYHMSEAFNTDGMVIWANCSKCDGYEVKDYKVSAIRTFGQKTVTISFTINGAQYNLEQPIQTPEAIEAEWAQNTSHGENEHWVEISGFTAAYQTNSPADSPASGAGAYGTYMGGYQGAGKAITFHIYAEKAVKVHIYLRACSAGYTQTDAGRHMNEYDLSKLLKVTLRTGNVTLPSTAIVPGYPEQYYYNWADVDFGVMTLKAGNNALKLESIDAVHLNIDCLEVVYLDDVVTDEDLKQADAIIEAEWAENATHGEYEHWVELSGFTVQYLTDAPDDSPASGKGKNGTYVNGFVSTGSTITFHIYSEQACKAQLYLHASNSIPDKSFNAYQTLTVTLNSTTTITLPDTVVLPIGGTPEQKNFHNWQDFDFTVVELQQGYNDLTIVAKSATPLKIDYLKVIFGVQ